ALRERPARRGVLRARAVQRQRELRSGTGPEGLLLRARRPSQQQQRQPQLGRSAGEIHLRQGRLPLLAPRQGRPHPLTTTGPGGVVHDVAVVGSGVFGSWTAWHLQRAGQSVALLDAYGPASSRASSGGETRILRMGYGPDELYTRWAWRSLEQWKALSARAGEATLFHETGVLWMAHEYDPRSRATLDTLARVGVPHERLDRASLDARWPQIDFGDVTWGI